MTDPTDLAIGAAFALVRHARELVPIDDPTGEADFQRAELLDLEDLFQPLHPLLVNVATPGSTDEALDEAARRLDQPEVRQSVPLVIWAALSEVRGRRRR